jgi:hypothetical protein
MRVAPALPLTARRGRLIKHMDRHLLQKVADGSWGRALEAGVPAFRDGISHALS